MTYTICHQEPCSPISVIDTINTCVSYTWIDGIAYTANNNTATYSLQTINGCDSLVTLNLTFGSSLTGVDTQEACNSYSWIDNITYTASNNTATYTLQSVNGCDSVVTLNLTINNSVSTIDTIVACDNFTWTNGITYTASNNTATYTFQTINGCDSLVYLDLTINNTTSASIIFINGDLVASAGISYQWLYNGSIISGATNQSHTPSNNGLYSVEITTVEGCNNTASFSLNNVSVSEQNSIDLIISPNPSSGIYNLVTNENVAYTIYNIIGDIIVFDQTKKLNHNIDISEKESGIYIIKIVTENNDVIVKQLIKN